jgi:hypothetical protein
MSAALASGGTIPGLGTRRRASCGLAGGRGTMPQFLLQRNMILCSAEAKLIGEKIHKMSESEMDRASFCH